VATRIAVVLSLWAGLPDREVGDLLGTPEDAVRGELIAGLAPLRAALAPVAAPWHVGVRLPDDEELREELGLLADEDVREDDHGDATAEAERTVAARRRHRWPVAIAAAAAAVVVAVPALSGEDPAPAPAPAAESPESSDRPRLPEIPPAVDLGNLPTRGSLAGDGEFLAGLVERPWEIDFPGSYPMDVTAAEDGRRVLYAGDVPAGRWALVVGRPEAVAPVEEGIGSPPFIGEEHLVAWFTGPPGAEPEEMELSTFPYGLMPGMFPALLDPPSGTLVVVAAPGDAVEVSERVEVDADGSDSRTWTPVPAGDGVAIAELDPVDLPWTWAVNYRIFRGDEGLIMTSPPDALMTKPASAEIPDLGVEYPGGAPDRAGRRAANWAAFIGLTSLGAPAPDTRITARVLEPVPGGEGTVALVTVTLPSGAFLVSAQWAWDIRADFPGAADCGLDVRPADPPPDERLLVAACEMFDPAEGRVMGHVLVASAPPDVTAVRLYRGNGAFLEEHPVSNGTLVVPMAEGTRTVEAVTAGGVSRGRSDLLGHWSPTTD
jgi:hypothetical protein